MNAERRILAAAAGSRAAYKRIDRHVGTHDLTEAGKLVYKHIGEYYARDSDAAKVDLDTLGAVIAAAVDNPKHRESFDTIIRGIAETDLSAANVAHELVLLKREAVSARLSSALLSSKNEGVEDLLEEYRALLATDEVVEDEEELFLHDAEVDDLFSAHAESDLIRIAPMSLTNRLDGGCLRGHHVLVFARPEMGKTMFLVNATAGFLAQGLRVLYLGNEEPIKDTNLRILCRLAEMTKYDVLTNRERAAARARERGYPNLWMRQLTPGTPAEIERLCEAISPDVLIVDQLRNIRMKEEDFVRKLEQAAQAVRQIGARQNCLVISVTQAGDSASGKSVLDMGDVDSSNTGIPGQADVMIGIGGTDNDVQSGRRVLSLPKNKRTGKHDFFPVRVDTNLSKIMSME
jgi:archaellum biogenesis ATPase FlaH